MKEIETLNQITELMDIALGKAREHFVDIGIVVNTAVNSYPGPNNMQGRPTMRITVVKELGKNAPAPGYDTGYKILREVLNFISVQFTIGNICNSYQRSFYDQDSGQLSVYCQIVFRV